MFFSVILLYIWYLVHLEEIPGADEYRKLLDLPIKEITRYLLNVRSYLKLICVASGIVYQFKAIRQFTRNLILDYTFVIM